MRLIACVILMSALASVEGSDDSVADNPVSYTDNLKCGPNALLAFLILSGRPQTTLAELGNIPVTSEGASLLSLRDAANQLGVKTEVRHYAIDALDSLPLPAIVLFKPQHFAVIYKVDHEHFYLIDGTTALPDVGRKSRLPDFWTGYALIEKRTLGGLPWHLRWVIVTALALLGAECAVLGYILWRRRLRNPKDRGREPTTPRPTCAGLGFICLAVFLLFPAARAGTPVAHPWRQAANGGVNVLYAYLAANGREADYSALVKKQAGNAAAEQYTVSTLAQMASSHGARLRAVWLTAHSDQVGHRFRFEPDRIPVDVGQRSGVCRTVSRSEATLGFVNYSLKVCQSSTLMRISSGGRCLGRVVGQETGPQGA